MLKFFSKYKILFYTVNFSFILIYLYPGSLIGLALYDDIKLQPQITPNFVISSNHFYAFIIISMIGFFTFLKSKKITYLVIYLIFLSLILEILHLFIPGRSFQWSDLFGNLFGVVVVILINNFINKYEHSKK
tara:strand:+ start:44 stop:439 length:396 start_codon:yes stop_codon:yes gene_type:complete